MGDLGEHDVPDSIVIVVPLPQYALARAITAKTEDSSKTMTVEGLDGLVQPPLDDPALLGRQGVEDPGRPPLLLKGRQHGLLVGSWNPKTFYHLPSNNQLSPRQVPLRNQLGYGRERVVVHTRTATF
jgi:hypothetical protein